MYTFGYTFHIFVIFINISNNKRLKIKIMNKEKLGEKYYITDDNFNEVGTANNIKEIQELVGCSRKHLYNELRRGKTFKGGRLVRYKKKEYLIQDSLAWSWYEKLQRINQQMDDANNMLNNINLN